ncbi:MAG: tetrahydrofolate dehydrogenase/cyclohydrolase catalytic domain-containing protein [Pyrinomonadaceae bacterium]
MAKILDGALVAEEIKREVREDVERLQRSHNLQPCPAVVRVGDDAASIVYVGNKMRTSKALGFRSEPHILPSDTPTKELLELIQTLNRREDVDGILVQLPLPATIDAALVLQAVDPLKDVDGLHPINVGRLALGEPALVPCTWPELLSF